MTLFVASEHTGQVRSAFSEPDTRDQAISTSRATPDSAVALKTFIALDTKQEDKLSREDRSLLGTYIFRPAATGIVNDDSALANLSELVSRINFR